MIEQVLFTALGERVNRPTFGCGLTQLLFAPNDTALAAAVNVTMQSPIAACSAISDEVGRLAACGTKRQFIAMQQFGRSWT
jgi:Baseplate wedge protein gp25